MVEIRPIESREPVNHKAPSEPAAMYSGTPTPDTG